MRKLLLMIGIFLAFGNVHAQFEKANYRLAKLKKQNPGFKSLKNVDLEAQKFVLIKDFEDHTERQIISVTGNQATYVEVFDDKALKKSSSNVFSGDVIKSDSGVLSFRFDELEGNKLPLPIAKNFVAMEKDNTLVLVDVNTKDRWISYP
ncbi:hypothetical protein [Chryseobacterium sp. A301]